MEKRSSIKKKKTLKGDNTIDLPKKEVSGGPYRNIEESKKH